MGLAVMTPVGPKSLFAFLQSPAGLGSFAAFAIAVGVSIEEMGTLRRIRLGIAFRLVAAAVLGAAVLWGVWLGAPSAAAAKFGWPFVALGAAGVAMALRVDAAAYDDPRSGQPVRLESISPDALRLSSGGVPILVPTSLLRGAELTRDGIGRGVLILVADRDRAIGAVDSLPWVSSDAACHIFLLTEHQAALDAEALLMQIRDATNACRDRAHR